MKISVIIPVYNAENTIKKCVESIIENQYKGVEIILVDDCSKDKSWHICQELSDMYVNIICIHNEKNRGVSYTRNQGLKVATGQYTMFVDSDDWVEKDYFDNFMDVVEKFQAKLAVCGYLNHDEKMNGSTKVYTWKDFEGIKKCDTSSIIKQLYDECLLQQLWNKLFVTQLIREHNIQFDESISIGEDCRFILEYISKCQIQELYLLNKVLYHYIRGQAGSLMYRVGYESVEEPLKNLRVLYEIMGIDEKEIEELISAERQKQIELYAYLIFHNSGMTTKEKKRLILALSQEQGEQLYKKNQRLFYKERIAIISKKFTKREK